MAVEELRELEAALAEESFGTAFDVLPEVLDETARFRRRGDQLQAVARRLPEDSDLATGYVTAASEASLTALSVATGAARFDARELSAPEYRDAVATAAERHADARDLEPEVVAAAVDAGLPPVVGLEPPETEEFPVGHFPGLAVRVRNVGGQPTPVLAASVESSLDGSASPSEMDPIAPGASATLTVEFPAPAPDEYTVSVAVSGDGVGETVDFAFAVRSAEAYLSRAATATTEVAEALEEAGRRGGVRGPVTQARSIADQLERIRAAVEDGQPGRSVEPRIGAVLNRLDAFRNALAAQSGTAVPARPAERARAKSEDVTDTLEDARRAL